MIDLCLLEKKKRKKERKTRAKQVKAACEAHSQRLEKEAREKALDKARRAKAREERAEAERLALEERMRMNLKKYEEWKRKKENQVSSFLVNHNIAL